MTFIYRSRRIPARYDLRKLVIDQVDQYGRRLQAFESLASSKLERDRRAETLQQYGCEELARKLRSCRKTQRCESMACPICSRIRRINTGYSVLKFTDRYVSADLRFGTHIDPGDAFPPGQLPTFRPELLLRRIRKQLVRLGIDTAGSFVLAYLDCEWDAGWELFQPHVHLIAYRVPDHVWRDMAVKIGKHQRVRVRCRIEPIARVPRAVAYLDRFCWLETARKGNPLGLKPRRPKRLPPELATEVYQWFNSQTPTKLRFYIGVKSYRRMLMRI